MTEAAALTKYNNLKQIWSHINTPIDELNYRIKRYNEIIQHTDFIHYILNVSYYRRKQAYRTYVRECQKNQNQPLPEF